MGSLVGDQKVDQEDPYREAIETQAEEEMLGYGIAEQRGLSLETTRTMQFIGGRPAAALHRCPKKTNYNSMSA